MKLRAFVGALLLCLISSVAFAASTKCPEHYWNGQAPDFLNEKLSAKSQEVCYSEYGLIHSGITRTPLTSAEHLTKERLNKPHPERVNAFHPDPHLLPDERAELNDYKNSGFDRGHMAPSGDMSSEQAQFESFSIANMIPQDSNNNRNLWEGIEAAVRDLARDSGQLYVVTGPIFYGSELKRINGRVLVPTYVFKAIYDPQRKEAAAYLVENAPGMRYAPISIAELEKLSGLRVFSQLPESVKGSAMKLPKPRAHSRKPGVEDRTLIPQKTSP